MKGIQFTIGLIGKSSLLPLCIMAPGCYACVYETQYRAGHLGVEKGTGNCKYTCCSFSGAYDVYDHDQKEPEHNLSHLDQVGVFQSSQVMVQQLVEKGMLKGSIPKLDNFNKDDRK